MDAPAPDHVADAAHAEALRGRVVRPRYYGGTRDYSVYRGRVVDVWKAPGTHARHLAQVVWFGVARRDLGPTTQYHAHELELDPRAR